MRGFFADITPTSICPGWPNDGRIFLWTTFHCDECRQIVCEPLNPFELSRFQLGSLRCCSCRLPPTRNNLALFYEEFSSVSRLGIRSLGGGL